MLHRTRHLFIRQQTAVINAIRAHLAVYGIVAAVGRNGVEELLGVVADPSDKRVPEIARACLAALGDCDSSTKRLLLAATIHAHAAPAKNSNTATGRPVSCCIRPPKSALLPAGASAS